MTDAERNESEREKWDLLVRRLGYSVWESEGDHDLTYEQVTLFDAAEVEVAVSSELRDRILAAIDALRAQLAAAQVDAERYRHMRANAGFQDHTGRVVTGVGERLDAAIDSALARATKESKDGE